MYESSTASHKTQIQILEQKKPNVCLVFFVLKVFFTAPL
uniref:Uncharacterized protein n=1 Tax=uncultured Flavobacteriia bacterium TaxID=212695 RepID=H6RIB1_9BACT|nr:hypothetical protein VIS_S3CEB40010 [uncultured Flavobacteriia bacterium]